MKNHQAYMLKAIDIAQKARGNVSPNPLVGCVIVKNKKIIAQGFHKKFGSAHAEINALKMAGTNAKAASLYVNLEPCAHSGKTPPCVDKIISSKIKQVIIGMRDPNPVNNGKGMKVLREAGINVISGICEKESNDLNAPFIKYINKNKPYVTLKVAQSIDGKIATNSGDSRWISCDESRRLVHKMRSQSDAIIVGVGTVIKDDPLLTDRRQQTADPATKKSGRHKSRAIKQPIKIVVDSKLRIPINARIFSKKSPAKTIIATIAPVLKRKVEQLREKNVEIIPVKSKNGRVDLNALMRILSNRGLINILMEGGSELATSAINEGIIDKLLVFIAPKIIGGGNAKSIIEGKGILRIADAINIKDFNMRKIGTDFLLEGRL